MIESANDTTLPSCLDRLRRNARASDDWRSSVADREIRLASAESSLSWRGGEGAEAAGTGADGTITFDDEAGAARRVRRTTGAAPVGAAGAGVVLRLLRAVVAVLAAGVAPLR